MSYKAILFGMLLILSVPAVSSAQSDFSGKGSYQAFINSAVNTLKQIVYVRMSGSLDFAATLTLANDAQFNDVIATLQMKDYFDTGTSTGAFSFVQDDVAGNFGVFIGTFK